MVRNATQEPPELDIPEDKAATAAKLDKMRQDGWKALEGMSHEELDALEAEADASYVWQPAKHGAARFNEKLHPHNQVCADALSAIVCERGRRNHEWMRHESDQMMRMQLIVEAAGHISEASRLIEDIAAVERDPGWHRVEDAPVIDVARAADEELAKTLQRCRYIADHADARPTAAQADVFAMMKGKEAAAIASELSARADAVAKLHDGAVALAAEIADEQRRREEKRHELEDRMTPEAIDARLRALEKLS